MTKNMKKTLLLAAGFIFIVAASSQEVFTQKLPMIW